MAAAPQKPTIFAIETAVVDLLYPEAKAGDGIKREFFANLRELVIAGGGTPWFDTNPRPGEMRMVPAEDLDAALITLARRHNLVSATDETLSAKDLAKRLRQEIFGGWSVSAGGSLANSVHALLTTKIDGQNLVDGQFATAVGADDSAGVFTQSFNGRINNLSGGRQMECHTFPIDGDRILIGSPSKTDPAEKLIGADLFEKRPAALENPTRIMLGGFLSFTPGLSAIFNSVAGYLDRTPAQTKPSLTLTTAAQAIAGDQKFRDHVWELTRRTDTVIHANTGEFRRLLDLDTIWRKPFEAAFAGLKGLELDQAKDNHIGYDAAKKTANLYALDAAKALCAYHHDAHKTKLRFVVTDGPRSIFVVSADGIETFTPQKVSRAQIVSTVGAGDNFAAGFQLGDLYGLQHGQCATLGSAFAASVIQQAPPRLDENRTTVIDGRIITGALSYAPADVASFLMR